MIIAWAFMVVGSVQTGAASTAGAVVLSPPEVAGAVLLPPSCTGASTGGVLIGGG
jgi:hypothetical protein